MDNEEGTDEWEKKRREIRVGACAFITITFSLYIYINFLSPILQSINTTAIIFFFSLHI